MASTTFSGPVTSTNGFIGAVTGTVTGALVGQVQASSQALSGAGAANLTTGVTFCTSTGAGNVVTLASPAASAAGLQKTIVHSTKGTSGTIVVTPTAASGFTTVTLTNVGTSVQLMWTGAAWVVLCTNGGTVA